MYLQINLKTEDVLSAVREGYGGVFEDGCLADRRAHPYLKPVEARPDLGIPEPKDWPMVTGDRTSDKDQGFVVAVKEGRPVFIVPDEMIRATGDDLGELKGFWIE